MTGGVVEAVAAVLREHRWSDGFTSNCNCGDEAVWTHSDHNAHVAAAVVEALALTAETAMRPPKTDLFFPWLHGIDIFSLEEVYRFVTPWVSVARGATQ